MLAPCDFSQLVGSAGEQAGLFFGGVITYTFALVPASTLLEHGMMFRCQGTLP